MSIRVTVNPSVFNRINADFLGLSFEKYILPQQYFAGSPVLTRLFRNLGTGVIRLGGITVDRTYWTRDPVANHSASDAMATVRPADVSRVIAFAREVGWKVVYGLNLASRLPDMSADEAAYVSSISSTDLVAYEIGNEPDIYIYTGIRNPYTYETYRQEFASALAALHYRVVGARVIGPVSSGTAWLRDFLAEFSAEMSFTALHFYPAEFATMDMLSRQQAVSSASTLAEGINISKQYGKAIRLTETNSYWGNQQQPDLSNTFVAALWGLDYLMMVASYGYGGAWIHGGFDDCTRYAPLCRTSAGDYVALPLYYAMLAFHSVGTGVILPTTVETSSNVTAYSVMGDDGILRVVVVNKDTSTPFTLDIDPGETYASAGAHRLQAPSVTAKTDITFAGAAVSPDGSWIPNIYEPVPRISDTVFSITVQAASAAVVSFWP